MPKEITHWTLAEQTRKNLRKESVLKQIIDSHINLYYVGAVILDTPFYCLWGSQKQFIMKAGQQIHNQRGNSLLPIQHIVKHYNFQVPDAIWALVLGMITHIWSDATFHPMINHFSGNKKNNSERKKAKYRHHFLETMLDIHFIDQEELINRFLFQQSYANKEIEEEEFLKALSLIYWNSTDAPVKILEKALKFHSFVQHSFLKQWPVKILQTLNLIPRMNLQPSMALFYPQTTPLSLPFFNQPITYRHPLSGKEVKSSISQLTKECLKNIGSTFNIISKCITQRKNSRLLQSHIAPNLNTGCNNSLAEEMQYFDTTTEIRDLVFNGQ